MLHLCPTCHRRFDQAGFCPFDGTSLVAGSAADQPTVVSGLHAAQPAPVTAALADQPPTIVAPAADPATIREPSTSLGALAAGRDDPATQLEARRGTFPLTPSPIVGTGEITAARPRPAPGASPRVRAASESAKIISRSASDDPGDALALYRDGRANEYDKLIGQTLDGRYHVVKKIGEGGMGVVFSARHTVIERPLAIKVLKRDAMRDAATIRRFVQEAKAASRIGHPNIVDVTDFGTTPDGMTYSVMEFVAGQTLGAALRAAAPFPAPRAIRITAQIARALAAAHDKGIVHRDLKPENVFLLDRDGRQDFVKIVDFGIAKVTPPSGQADGPRLTRAGSVFGTPEYMAPEQAAGRSDTDGRVDIYALGVIFYEMICGRVPHRGDSMVRTLAMQMLDPIEPPSRVRPDLAIAPDLEAVVMHALAKKREQRFQKMGELLAALETILPPAVAQSVTGSPVYTLAALPPGADPGVVASQPAAPLAAMPVLPPGAHPPGPGSMPSPSSDSAPQPAYPVTQPGVDPARAATTRRPRDEPEFTAGDRPRSFAHVFTEDHTPARPRRWPLLLVLAALGGGSAGAIALVIKHRGDIVERAPRDAGVISDAAIVPSDAGLDATGPDDAELDGPELDAGRVLHVPPRRDPGPGPGPGPNPTPGPGPGPGPSLPETPNHRGTIHVQVITKPEGANLFEGTHYRGPGGTQLEEPLGARLTITCRQAGYRTGSVEVNFDGNSDAVLCVLQRIKICINNIKNPFDDCELAPGTPGAPAPEAPQPTPSATPSAPVTSPTKTP